MTTTTGVVVPCDESRPLHELALPTGLDEQLESVLVDQLWVASSPQQRHSWSIDHVRSALLLRPSSQGGAGLYAYHYQNNTITLTPNVRATRLAMACGMFSCQFHGPVLLVRSHFYSRQSLVVADVQAVCCISPDLRKCIIGQQQQQQVPVWLASASQQNYHDKAALLQLAHVMIGEVDSRQMRDHIEHGDGEDEEEDDDDDSTGSSHEDVLSDTGPLTSSQPSQQSTTTPRHEFVTKQTLCLHCRRPASTLCEGCHGAYFCDPPRTCRTDGWTHACQCKTWKIYTDRRLALGTFEFYGNVQDEDGAASWTQHLTSRPFQLSEEPYQQFLTSLFQQQLDGSQQDENIRHDSAEPLASLLEGSSFSWWTTEIHGWAGGDSLSAKTVDIFRRQTYQQGFYPLAPSQLPPQRRIQQQDLQRLPTIRHNSVGLFSLSGWGEYYRLRQIPLSSPAALLLTFPMTVYHAMTEIGQVPCQIAFHLLQRPLRIHIVGVEKEANFLDLFQEIGFLLPESFCVELVFVVRQDMLPPKARPTTKHNNNGESPLLVDVELSSNVRIRVVAGTYGDSLDPNFDCGSTIGPPDMIIGMNAGFFAYDSWRSVVAYLHNNKGVVGVFTDYNEHSGMNCASLAGDRESLCVNPFRQPRAMPVYSMNLPQMGNGFLYAFNEQALE